MDYVSHGGHCCGLKTVHGFDMPNGLYSNQTDLEHVIRDHDANGNRVLEAVLTDEQCEAWQQLLIDRGFVKIARWRNQNSDNFCNTFYRYLCLGGYGSIQFFGQGVDSVLANAAPDPVIAPVIPELLRPVVTEHYANLRVGGRRGPFSTVLEASQAYPRCRQFHRRQIMNDGSSNWSTLE